MDKYRAFSIVCFATGLVFAFLCQQSRAERVDLSFERRTYTSSGSFSHYTTQPGETVFLFSASSLLGFGDIATDDRGL